MDQLMDRFLEMIDEDEKMYKGGSMNQEYIEKMEKLHDTILMEITKREIERVVKD